MGVHPPQIGGIGYDPWPHICARPSSLRFQTKLLVTASVFAAGAGQRILQGHSFYKLEADPPKKNPKPPVASGALARMEAGKCMPYARPFPTRQSSLLSLGGSF